MTPNPINTTSPSDFQPINPFAGHSPFLLFYNSADGRRIYQVDGLGCVTPDLFQATRYEIDKYEYDLGHVGDAQHRPRYVTIPVCAYCPSPGAGYEFYAGNHRIQLDPACGKSNIHQAACGAKKLARPLFRLGGPCGAVIQTGTRADGVHIAYFGIDLLFYLQGNVRVPDSLEGFTRAGINHFVSIPRYW